MNKIFIILIAIFYVTIAHAQETVYPAPAQTETIALTNATVHIGNGQVIENGTVVFSNGKITAVQTEAVGNARVIDCSGKHIYPGVILAGSQLGLVEISAVRSTLDNSEEGDINPGVRSIIAYNTDSKIINTLRTNGILLAQVEPGGGIVSGTSSIVQLDAWNWEDAVYSMDNGIHLRMPQTLIRSSEKSVEEQLKETDAQIDNLRNFFSEANAYLQDKTHPSVNIKFDAVKGLFNKSQTLFVHAELVREMMTAIEFSKEFSFKTVIVGGADSYKIAPYLKENNIPVILNEMHTLPGTQDDAVDAFYKLPAQLQQAGVMYCITDRDESNRGRNLMFNAGNAVPYGITKEQALQAITLNAAKILGIDNRTGSLEAGKDANIVVSDGDLLDIMTNNVVYAFIQGRQLNLDNKQKQLHEKYKYKYNLK